MTDGAAQPEATPESPPGRLVLLDRRRWLANAVYFDLLALAAMLVLGAGIAVDVFMAGKNAVSFVDGAVYPRLALEAALFMVAFAWVATRLLMAGFREATLTRRGG